MVEAVGMPDLDLFMPGLLEFGVRCGGLEFKQRIVVGRLWFRHRSLLFNEWKCIEVSGGELARLIHDYFCCNRLLVRVRTQTG